MYFPFYNLMTMSNRPDVEGTSTCLGSDDATGSFVTIHALIVLKGFLYYRKSNKTENWKRIVATVCESYQSSNQTWRTVDGLL